MNRPTWRRAVGTINTPRPDPAPALLASVAIAIESRASGVLRGRATLSIGQPQRGGWSGPRGSRARIWRSDDDVTDLWCVVDDAASSALLEHILGGPGAIEPTALERSILRETMHRLLESSERMWDEQATARPPESDAWRCALTIASTSGNSAEVYLVAPAAPQPPPPASLRLDVRRIPLGVTAALAPFGVPIADLFKWCAGTVVPLRCQADAVVLVTAGSTAIATGRLGVARGRRAVLIHRLVSAPQP